jgi:hypothetical protein
MTSGVRSPSACAHALSHRGGPPPPRAGAQGHARCRARCARAAATAARRPGPAGLSAGLQNEKWRGRCSVEPRAIRLPASGGPLLSQRPAATAPLPRHAPPPFMSSVQISTSKLLGPVFSMLTPKKRMMLGCRIAGDASSSSSLCRCLSRSRRCTSMRFTATATGGPCPSGTRSVPRNTVLKAPRPMTSLSLNMMASRRSVASAVGSIFGQGATGDQRTNTCSRSSRGLGHAQVR